MHATNTPMFFGHDHKICNKTLRYYVVKHETDGTDGTDGILGSHRASSSLRSSSPTGIATLVLNICSHPTARLV